MATYRDKLERIIRTVEQKTALSNLVPGTKAYQIAEAHAYEQMLQEAAMDSWSEKNSIVSATGRDLDEIGKEFFKVQRLKGIAPYISSSMKALKFYVEGGLTFGDINSTQISGASVAQDISIPEGTLISGSKSGTSYQFRVTEDTVLSKNSSEAYVNAQLIQGPLDQIPSGILKLHSFEGYSQNVNKLLKVTNPVPINSGREEESDSNFRYRISNSLRSFPKTTAIAIHQIVSSMPGVSNAFIDSAANGGGTFTVYVQGTTPVTGDEIIEDVEMALMQIVSPWQINYNVVKPNYLGISCSVEVILRDSFNENMGKLIGTRVSDFLNNFNGETFYVNSILSLVQGLHSDILDVKFNYARLYVGSEDIRGYTEFDFETEPNPTIELSSKEKIIAEPMVNAVEITTTV